MGGGLACGVLTNRRFQDPSQQGVTDIDVSPPHFQAQCLISLVLVRYKLEDGFAERQMPSSKQMASLKRLKEFFRSEIQAEVRSGFARLARVPASHVAEKMKYYGLLSKSDKVAFLDCCAFWASAHYGFVINAPKMELTNHPFFSKWSRGPSWNRDFDNVKSVLHQRWMVQQYKMDLHRKVPSSITKEQFEHASSIRSIKAPELRKRVRAALKPFGHYETDWLGNYWCKKGEKTFYVSVDFAGRYAQLRYSVARPEFKAVHPLSQFRFERAMGFGLGDWDYIVEENVEDVFSLFAEVVQYSFDLPDRIRAAAK